LWGVVGSWPRHVARLLPSIDIGWVGVGAHIDYSEGHLGTGMLIANNRSAI
jgi:hypothetical protein